MALILAQGIAVPSTFVSIRDLNSVKNGLQTMYKTQVMFNSKNLNALNTNSFVPSIEPYNRSTSRSWAASTSARVRHLPHVDYDKDVQLSAL
jgi:hypothetical protein